MPKRSREWIETNKQRCWECHCNKKRKRLISDRCLNNTTLTHTDDRKQYGDIFIAIQKSNLGSQYGVENHIVQDIAEFSVGQWVPCNQKNCDEAISFLVKDGHENKGITCIDCETKAYYRYCMVHKQAYTVCGYLTRCSRCLNSVCPEKISNCVECCIWTCEICMQENNICLEGENVKIATYYPQNN